MLLVIGPLLMNDRHLQRGPPDRRVRRRIQSEELRPTFHDPHRDVDGAWIAGAGGSREGDGHRPVPIAVIASITVHRNHSRLLFTREWCKRACTSASSLLGSSTRSSYSTTLGRGTPLVYSSSARFVGSDIEYPILTNPSMAGWTSRRSNLSGPVLEQDCLPHLALCST